MIYTLFTLGSIMFWVLCIVTLIIMTAFVESNRKYGWATTTLAASLTAMFFFGARDFVVGLWDYTYNNPAIVGFGFLGYVLCAIGWSRFKWIGKLRHGRLKLDEAIASAAGRYLVDVKRYRPYAVDNKDLIVSWMIYWPLSLFWYVTNNPIRKIFTWVYDKVSGMYDRLGDKHFEVPEQLLIESAEGTDEQPVNKKKILNRLNS